MLPKSVSASALSVYNNCPSRFYHENVLRSPTPSNSAADLGTVCHGVLEVWVQNGHHKDRSPFTKMQAFYVQEYFKYFDETDRYDEGLEMLERWYNRQDFETRAVVSTEQKKTFPIPYTKADGTQGEIPLNYIMDRMDLHSDNLPEVVDYKTIREAVQPDQLKHMMQPRVYGLAAQMEYREAERIRVTYDLLRYDTVGVMFTKEENRLTYKHIVGLVQRIVDDEPTGQDGEVWPKESINPDCRYCVRKSECASLLKHQDAGGLVGVKADDDSIEKYVNIRSKAKWQMDALKMLVEETDTVITNYLQDTEQTEWENENLSIKVASRSVRKVEADDVKRIVPEEIWRDYSTIGLKDVEKILADPRMTDEKRSQVKSHIKKIPGNRFLRSSKKVVIDE